MQCAAPAVVHKSLIMMEAIRKCPSYITPATGRSASHNQHPDLPDLAFSTLSLSLRSDSLPDDDFHDQKACVLPASCLPGDE